MQNAMFAMHSCSSKPNEVASPPVRSKPVTMVRTRRSGTVQVESAHQNRIAMMGQLSASIAHEVCQPITGVMANAHVALKWLATDPPNLAEAAKAIARIVRDGNRATDIVERVRAMTRNAPVQPGRVDINFAIREALELTHGERMRHAISLETDLACNLPNVRGDCVQLQQVIVNLIVNAVDAMGATSNGTRHLAIRSATHGRDEVLVSVRDSGAGLDPSQIGRVFDAFYTTKPNGMGMGLSICRTIIGAHGGRMWAAPAIPRGTVFTFAIPVNSDG
jgi:C4-dicarboxylate-specific signal transduction histidine kinase